MDKKSIANITEDTIFLYCGKINCKKIGEYRPGYFIIAPIKEEENIRIARKEGFWPNSADVPPECKSVINAYTKSDISPIYYAVNGAEEFENPIEYKNEKYLFPNIKEL